MLSKDSKILASITLPTLSEKTVSIAENDDKTVLYFFAPWCQVCHVSIGNLQQLHESNPQLKIVAIALDYVDKQEVNKFVKQHRLTFDVALGTEETKHQFNITGYPSYYVLDEQNTVIGRSLGYSSEVGLYLRTL